MPFPTLLKSFIQASHAAHASEQSLNDSLQTTREMIQKSWRIEHKKDVYNGSCGDGVNIREVVEYDVAILDPGSLPPIGEAMERTRENDASLRSLQESIYVKQINEYFIQTFHSDDLDLLFQHEPQHPKQIREWILFMYPHAEFEQILRLVTCCRGIGEWGASMLQVPPDLAISSLKQILIDPKMVEQSTLKDLEDGDGWTVLQSTSTEKVLLLLEDDFMKLLDQVPLIEKSVPTMLDALTFFYPIYSQLSRRLAQDIVNLVTTRASTESAVNTMIELGGLWQFVADSPLHLLDANDTAHHIMNSGVQDPADLYFLMYSLIKLASENTHVSIVNYVFTACYVSDETRTVHGQTGRTLLHDVCLAHPRALSTILSLSYNKRDVTGSAAIYHLWKGLPIELFCPDDADLEILESWLPDKNAMFILENFDCGNKEALLIARTFAKFSNGEWCWRMLIRCRFSQEDVSGETTNAAMAFVKTMTSGSDRDLHLITDPLAYLFAVYKVGPSNARVVAHEHFATLIVATMPDSLKYWLPRLSLPEHRDVIDKIALVSLLKPNDELPLWLKKQTDLLPDASTIITEPQGSWFTSLFRPNPKHLVLESAPAFAYQALLVNAPSDVNQWAAYVVTLPPSTLLHPLFVQKYRLFHRRVIQDDYSSDFNMSEVERFLHDAISFFQPRPTLQKPTPPEIEERVPKTLFRPVDPPTPISMMRDPTVMTLPVENKEFLDKSVANDGIKLSMVDAEYAKLSDQIKALDDEALTALVPVLYSNHPRPERIVRRCSSSCVRPAVFNVQLVDVVPVRSAMYALDENRRMNTDLLHRYPGLQDMTNILLRTIATAHHMKSMSIDGSTWFYALLRQIPKRIPAEWIMRQMVSEVGHAFIEDVPAQLNPLLDTMLDNPDTIPLCAHLFHPKTVAMYRRILDAIIDDPNPEFTVLMCRFDWAHWLTAQPPPMQSEVIDLMHLVFRVTAVARTDTLLLQHALDSLSSLVPSCTSPIPILLEHCDGQMTDMAFRVVTRNMQLTNLQEAFTALSSVDVPIMYLSAVMEFVEKTQDWEGFKMAMEPWLRSDDMEEVSLVTTPVISKLKVTSKDFYIWYAGIVAKKCPRECLHAAFQRQLEWDPTAELAMVIIDILESDVETDVALFLRESVDWLSCPEWYRERDIFRLVLLLVATANPQELMTDVDFVKQLSSTPHANHDRSILDGPLIDFLARSSTMERDLLVYSVVRAASSDCTSLIAALLPVTAAVIPREDKSKWSFFQPATITTTQLDAVFKQLLTDIAMMDTPSFTEALALINAEQGYLFLHFPIETVAQHPDCAVAMISAACMTVWSSSSLAWICEGVLEIYFKQSSDWAPVIDAFVVPELDEDDFVQSCVEHGHALTLVAREKKRSSEKFIDLVIAMNLDVPNQEKFEMMWDECGGDPRVKEYLAGISSQKNIIGAIFDTTPLSGEMKVRVRERVSKM